jgi:hypothetical protein
MVKGSLMMNAWHFLNMGAFRLWVFWPILSGKNYMAIRLILTGIFTLNQPMFVCSDANSVRIPAYMHTRKKVGN